MKISTHTPLTGCNKMQKYVYCAQKDFYSHTPHGVQLNLLYNINIFLSFLLTHPSRGATIYYTGKAGGGIFLLTHPSRGATQKTALWLMKT